MRCGATDYEVRLTKCIYKSASNGRKQVMSPMDFEVLEERAQRIQEELRVADDEAAASLIDDLIGIVMAEKFRPCLPE